ncbi:hypothetical protein [Albidovulum sp.]
MKLFSRYLSRIRRAAEEKPDAFETRLNRLATGTQRGRQKRAPNLFDRRRGIA